MIKHSFSNWLVKIIIGFVFFIFTNVSIGAPEVGTIKGNFNVTPTGQAHYSIPIDVPPGTAGMTPALSIVYDSSSSNTRNGLLGAGFSLDGLTAITRCPSNKTQNGLIHGVDFTDQDRFCLNGEQLVAVKGNYGADGTEYRTYIDSKTKIISYGRQENGPASFKVWTKGGQVAEYGLTTDSQIKAEGKNTVAVWNLNKIQDTVGNYLEVHYFKDEAKGSFYPVEINYTGNEKAKVLPYNSIKFIYEERPDTKTAYQAGSKNILDKRLKSIQVYQGLNLIYEYQLTYEISKNTYRSRITAIQKCSGSGACLSPTKFEWQTNEEGWIKDKAFEPPISMYEWHVYYYKETAPSWKFETNYYDGVIGKFIDLNGTGLPSIVKMWSEGVFAGVFNEIKTDKETFINTGNTWVKDDKYTPPTFLFTKAPYEQILKKLVGRYILDKTYSKPSFKYYTHGYPYMSPVGQFVDLKGSGLPDLVQAWYDSSEAPEELKSAFMNTGNGWVKNDAYIPPVPIFHKAGQVGQFVDLRGTGLPDLVQAWSDKDSKEYKEVFINTGTGWTKDDKCVLPTTIFKQFESNGGIFQIGYFVDLRGNGLPDLIQTWSDKDSKEHKEVFINTGTGWVKDDKYTLPTAIFKWDSHEIYKQQAATQVNIKDEIVQSGLFLDLKGSGRPDIINIQKEVFINTGAGWIKDDAYTLTLPSRLPIPMNTYIQFVDIRGSGLPDLIKCQVAGGSIGQVFVNTGNKWVNNNNYVIKPMDIRGFIRSYGFDKISYVDLRGIGLPDIVASCRVEVTGGDYVTEGSGLPKVGPSPKTYEYEITYLNCAQKLPDYLISITDGYGAKLDIDYEPLSGKKVEVYTKEHDAEYPNMDWQGPMYVVYQTSSNTAATGSQAINIPKISDHITTYHYTGAKFNHLGLGFLGFHKMTVTDQTTGITTTTTYSQNISLHNKGVPVASETRLADKTLITSTEDTWELKTFGDGGINATYYMPYIKKSEKNSYDFKGSLISKTTVSNIIDDYGNPIEIITKIHEETPQNDFITKTENTYHNDPEKWLLGELVTAKVTKSSLGKLEQTRTSSFTYDPRTSLLMQAIAEPDDAKLKLVTKYKRDTFGNIVNTTISGQGIEDRVAEVKYDDYGRFIIQSTNPLKQSVSQILDPRFGAIAESTDLNGLRTKYQYDDFGRVILQIAPDGTKTDTSYNWVNSSSIHTSSVDIPAALKNVSYVVTIHTENSTMQKEYYDILGRKIASTTQNMDGKIIWQLMSYDELGRVSQKSLPFFEGYPVYYTKIQYDVLGRTISSILPDGYITRVIYDGFTTTTINQSQQRQIKEVNAVGNLIKTVDNLGAVVTYQYDAYSNMTSIKDSVGNISMIKYDELGRKIAINDPDKGTWGYQYDVLGNLISQSDAYNHTTTFKYDKLNRMISRTDNAGTSTWEYDTAPNGIGKLAKINSLNLAGKGAQEKIEAPAKAIHDGLEVYTRDYSYDNFGRLVQAKTVIKNQTYTSSYSYDKNSRLDIETYPNGLQVKNSYNELGYLVQISDAQTGKVYWKLNAKDAAGHIISESRSNGLITNYTYSPKTGFLDDIETVLNTSLSIQKDLMPALAGTTITKEPNKSSATTSLDTLSVSSPKIGSVVQKEIYRYDVFGNVTAHQDGINAVTENFQYDDLNRLVGIESSGRADQTLFYDALGNIISKSDVGAYKYGENGAGPHALTSIKGKQPGTFEYNANGDQIKGTLNGIERTITYTSYSKPLTITTSKATVSFYYNAEREKFARVDNGPSKIATTYYLGNYELVTINNKGGPTIIQQKAYIGSNTICIKTEDSSDSKNNGVAVYEMLRNNLGSVTDITDENGNVKQHFSYTPFGEQKQTKGAVPYHPITYKGFTGHEEINVDGIDLIHMDGRIYDPVVGRFLSADPYIQDPGNSQSLNRYSYCINNPLAFTDPTGFGFWGSLFRSIGSFFSNPVVRILTGVAVGILVGPAGGAIFGLGGGAGITSSWLAASAIGSATTMGLGAATGAGWKQTLFEGTIAFAAVGCASSQYVTAQVGGVAGSAAAAGIKGPSNESSESKPKEQGEDFPDQTLHDSTNKASPLSGDGSYESKMSDRARDGSNYSNGAGTEAFAESHGRK
ncbi:MAG TPA: hypothetical protein DCZ38_00070, partial [Coxiellaceae bacterium]|nr:hypothetical protein [Coxiellaceae bacterium]